MKNFIIPIFICAVGWVDGTDCRMAMRVQYVWRHNSSMCSRANGSSLNTYLIIIKANDDLIGERAIKLFFVDNLIMSFNIMSNIFYHKLLSPEHIVNKLIILLYCTKTRWCRHYDIYPFSMRCSFQSSTHSYLYINILI